MRRWLFTFLAAVSLLVGLSAGALWIRSYWVSDQIQWPHPAGYGWASTAKGSIIVGTSAETWTTPPPGGFGIRYLHDAPSPPVNGLIFLNMEADDHVVDWSRFGFSWYAVRNTRTRADYGQAIVPFWMIFSVAIVLPVTWGIGRMRSRRGRRQSRSGLCPACGYDLRATPDRCPECGRAVLRDKT